MVLSQKSQYAVRAVFELAKQQTAGPVSAGRIAEAECIPVRFLENILGQLRQGGTVASVRGKEGGYRLARDPWQITVGEVIRLMQGDVSAIDCADAGPDGRDQTGDGRPCRLRAGCVLFPMWDKAHRAMMDVFDETTFGELVEQERTADTRQAIDYVI
jgi:Rrf2 family protein